MCMCMLLKLRTYCVHLDFKLAPFSWVRVCQYQTHNGCKCPIPRKLSLRDLKNMSIAPGFEFMDTNTKRCRSLCCFAVLFYPLFLPDPQHNAILAVTEIFRTWVSQFPSFGVFFLSAVRSRCASTYFVGRCL